MKSLVLSLALLAAVAPLSAQQQIQPSISISPEWPSTRDTIIIDTRVPWSDCMGPIREVSRDGFEITIGLRSTGALCPVTTIDYSTHVAIGALPAGTYQVRVVRQPDNLELLTQSFEVAPEAIITSIEPRYGPVEGGTTVTIHGENLYQDEICSIFPGPCNNTYVFFGTVAVTILSHSSDSLVVSAPPHPAGLVDVGIYRSDGRGALQHNAFLFGDRALDTWLLPVSVPSPVAGAYDSRWITELAIENDEIYPAIFLLPPAETYSRILPGDVYRTPPTPRFAGGGSFLYVDHSFAPLLKRSLRVRNLNARSGEFAIPVPIVTQEEATYWTLDFIDIPTDPRFRITVRVYDFDGEHGRSFGIGASRTSGQNRDLGSFQGVTSRADDNSAFTPWPGYAEVNDLASRIPNMRSETNVNLEVSSGGLFPMWAMLTITDNETQQVTVVTPSGQHP